MVNMLNSTLLSKQEVSWLKSWSDQILVFSKSCTHSHSKAMHVQYRSTRYSKLILCLIAKVWQPQQARRLRKLSLVNAVLQSLLEICLRYLHFYLHVFLKVSFPIKLYFPRNQLILTLFESDHLTTFLKCGHSELHTHAACENVLLPPSLALAIEGLHFYITVY